MKTEIEYNGLLYEYHSDIKVWWSTGLIAKTRRYTFTPGLVINHDFIEKLNRELNKKHNPS